MRNIRYNKNIYLVIASIFVLAILFSFRETLSKYVSTIIKTGQTQVAAWNIKVNDVELLATPVSVEPIIINTSSEDVLGGKIAPGTELIYRLVFDPTGTEVRVEYEVEIDDTFLSENPNIYIDRVEYKIGSGDDETFVIIPQDNKIKVVPPASSILDGEKLTLDIIIKWNENSEIDDYSIYKLINNQISIPILAGASQYLKGSGEVLESKDYRIVFNANSGTFKNQTTSNSLIYRISTNDEDESFTDIISGKYQYPSKANYSFVGWTINKNNTGKVYNNLEEISELNEEYIILYAKYEELSVKYLNGIIFNNKIKSLANNTTFSNNQEANDFEDTNIKYIKWATIAPDTSSFTTNNIVSTNDSSTPIYAWFDTDTIWLYSESSNLIAPNEMNRMFLKLHTLQELDLYENLHIVDTSNTTNLASCFSYCHSLKTLKLDTLNTENVTNLSYLFSNSENLQNVDVSKFDTSNCIYFGAMFRFVPASTINVSNFDVSNGKYFGQMFLEATGVENLDFSNWDTSNALQMYKMFWRTSSLESLDISSFDTSNLSGEYACRGMFAYNSNVKSIKLGNNCTFENADNFSRMFLNCFKLKSIDLSKVDSTKFTTIEYLFSDCNDITSIIFPKTTTPNLEKMSYAFAYCNSIEELELTTLDTRNVTDMSYAFRNCNNLQTIYASNKFIASNSSVIVTDMFLNCNNLVGQMGTKYSASYDYTYVSLDQGNIAPGYLSELGELHFNYYYNDGTEQKLTYDYEKDQTAIIIGSPTSRNGYIFLGWSTSGPSGDISYYSGDTVTVSTGFNLYAKWSLETYENAGPFVFTGSNNINTGVYLFSKETKDLNFEVSFTITEDYPYSATAGENTNTNKANYFSSVHEEVTDVYPGVQIRKNTSNNIDIKANITHIGDYTISAAPIIDSQLTILRLNGKYYYRYGGNLCNYICDLSDFPNTFNLPALFGSSMTESGTIVNPWKGTLSNMKVALNVDFEDYLTDEYFESLTTIFESGEMTFDGTDDYYIPTNSNTSTPIYLFNSENKNKNFEITFTISNENYSQNVGQATVVTNMDEVHGSPWPGFVLRLPTSLSTTGKYEMKANTTKTNSPLSKTIADNSIIKIFRYNNVIYLSITTNGIKTNYIIADFSSWTGNFDYPLTFGASLNENGVGYRRFFKGQISDVQVKIED